MKLLIVDDEISSIRAVSNMLDWAALGIEQVCTALSAQEAREHIQKGDVDILLCDIEMPQESGLDLLEWVNQEKLDICCVYMTCYPEFSYVQRALKLGSMAYLLKPIDPKELEQEIAAAIQRKREMSQMRTAHRLMTENVEKNCWQFWRDLFYEEIPSTTDAIQEQIERLNLPLDLEWSYCPVLLVVRRWNKSGQEEDGESYGRYAAHNVAQELFTDKLDPVCPWYTVLQFGKNAQLALCGGPDGETLRQSCEAFARSYLEAELAWLEFQTVCYVGKAMPIEKTAAEIEELLRMDNNHLQNQGLVLHNDGGTTVRAETDLSGRFERWTSMLEGKLFAKARREIEAYLDSQKENRWFNRRRFTYFLNSYAGMLVGYAERHSFPLHQLTADPQNADCFERSDQSLEEMRLWVGCSLTQLEQACGEKGGDPVVATKAFIEAHLSDDLDVALIAENVHLNQDYLTRIFKREIGVSVKSYMVNRRMEKAKELLETSRLPITDVAYQVGYYNYTSFNRIFKKTYGMSPQSFRKQAD